ncbi:hypothetical protein F4808DRAFT_440256 [Astrocystis sublimbata]|nr:hypothetical protein F4808DRAFT_440256 [Astrocystis sublimbata]
MGFEDNPFVRFKNFVDNNVRRGVDLVLSSSQATSSAPSPSTTSSSPDLVPLHKESITTPSVDNKDNNNNTPPLHIQRQAQSSLPSSSSPPLPPSTSPTLPSRTLSSRLRMPDNASNTAAIAVVSDQDTNKTTNMNEVHAWAVDSPYSPLNLQHLPQPVPRGVPRSHEGDFTFRDAFEDLLVAGSGKPVPSTRELVWKKKREHFPFWEKEREEQQGKGLHVTQWVGGLAQNGLWNSYFKLDPPPAAKPGHDKDREAAERPLYFREPAPAAPRGTKKEFVWGNWDDRPREAHKSSFGGRGVWGAAWKMGMDSDSRWESDSNNSADVEDELYGKSTTDCPTSPRRDRFEAPWTESGGLRKPSIPELRTTTYPDGSKNVKETVREESDGKTKITSMETRYDPAGNIVSESQESSTTRNWSGSVPGAGAEASFSWSWNSDKENNKRKRDDEGREGEPNWEDRKDEKKGWFWNR